jgi:hypothetical protein
LAPTFGLEPSVVDHVASRFDVLEYNFLKEFLEEIYGIDALARNAESGLLDPDAIFDNPEAERLVAEFDSGRATLQVTGVGGRTDRRFPDHRPTGSVPLSRLLHRGQATSTP